MLAFFVCLKKYYKKYPILIKVSIFPTKPFEIPTIIPKIPNPQNLKQNRENKYSIIFETNYQVKP